LAVRLFLISVPIQRYQALGQFMAVSSPSMRHLFIEIVG